MNNNYFGIRTGMMLGVLLGFVLWTIPAQANLKEIKKYKEAYPEAKPVCINCHAADKPKKEDGQHDMNDYGKAVLKAAGEPKAAAAVETTVETYQKVGKIKDFKADKK